MRRFVLVLLLLFASACSMRSAIEAMTSPEDRAFAQEMVNRLRRADEAWLQQHFDADLWAQSNKQIAAVPAMFPEAAGTTELIGYNFQTSTANGVTRRNRQFTLVTHDEGRWTVTSFRTFSDGGPDRVVQWSVVPRTSPPPELAMLEGMDRVLPWVWGGLLVFLLLAVALIVWLVRRSRRRHAYPPTGKP